MFVHVPMDRRPAIHFNVIGVSHRNRDHNKPWSFSMDAVAAGMIFLLLSSAWLAWERKEKWVGRAIAFAAGLAACGFFMVGLRWL